MITLRKGETSESIFVTLTESLTLEDPIINFIFKHVNTEREITFDVQLSVDDISNYPLRYNEIVINTAALMGDSDTGQWTYDCIENGTGVRLETGKLQYFDVATSIFTENNPSTSYKAHNG